MNMNKKVVQPGKENTNEVLNKKIINIILKRHATCLRHRKVPDVSAGSRGSRRTIK
jgi:hypothetical protein